MIALYTLKSCDTCKKALRWLDENGIEYANHDVRADGLERETVKQIVESVGWEVALNRRSTTWRNLEESDKAEIDNAKAVELILQHPTLMKRPIMINDGKISVGFTDEAKDIASGT